MWPVSGPPLPGLHPSVLALAPAPGSCSSLFVCTHLLAPSTLAPSTLAPSTLALVSTACARWFQLQAGQPWAWQCVGHFYVFSSFDLLNIAFVLFQCCFIAFWVYDFVFCFVSLCLPSYVRSVCVCVVVRGWMCFYNVLISLNSPLILDFGVSTF